jgi:hypothetical protein
MRIIDKLTEFINRAGYVVTDVDSFYTEDSERLMLRQDPSPAVETRYYDGARSGQFAYSLYAKSMNHQTAVAILYGLEDVLDFPNGMVLDAGFIWSKKEIVQSAHFVTKTDKNEKIYTSSFVLDYHVEA